MLSPLVSVVIPVWNGEKTLVRCLESIRQQTWPELEIFVVDDGSTDRTPALLEELAAQDARIRVIRQANAGVSEARNAALPLCRGKYIRFVDCDDTLPADSMATLVRKAEDSGSDLVLAAYTEVVGPMHHVRALVKREDTVALDEYLAILNRKANSFYCGVLWNKLFRTALVQEQQLRFTSGLSYGEDMLFVCQYLAGAEKISYTRSPVYNYIRNAAGITAHQTVDSLVHPVRNLRVKWQLYEGLRQLYVQRGQYDRYRRSLWLYMVRVTVNE